MSMHRGNRVGGGFWDDTRDKRLIKYRLQHKMSYKAIGEALGIGHNSIAARLERLEEEGKINKDWRTCTTDQR